MEYPTKAFNSRNACNFPGFMTLFKVSTFATKLHLLQAILVAEYHIYIFSKDLDIN